MIGTKWLSEAININDIQTGALNTIIAPTGSGKSTFALKDFPAIAENKNKILYLIDTINGREQLLQKENTAPCSQFWIDEICKNVKMIFWEDDTVFDNDKIVVMTYAKFGSLADAFPEFGYTFAGIVCDELHSGIEMIRYTREGKNLVWLAINRLKGIVRASAVKVVALTATPSYLEKEFSGSLRYIKVDSDIRQYETFREIPYTNLDALIPLLKKREKGIIYTGHITQMKAIEAETQRLGFNSIAIWSIRNADHPMTEEQLSAREHILSEMKLPPPYNLLIINKSCETSITIDGDIDYMVIHSQSPDRRIQVRGRLRRDLEKMYVLDYNAELIVPPEYMGIKLFTEDKKQLCGILKARNRGGNLVAWTTTEDELIRAGYTITKGRQDNKRYVIITA